MRPEELSDAIGAVNESYIESADRLRQGSKNGRKKWTRRVALAACLCLVIGIGAAALGRGYIDPANIPLGSTGAAGSSGSAGPYDSECPGPADGTVGGRALALAAYPEVVQFPDESEYTNILTGSVDYNKYSEDYGLWREGRSTALELSETYAGRLDSFYAATLQQFLTTEDGENSIYSPVNMYLALCMLAEVTDGETRQQILDLIGVDSVEEARSVAGALWTANYCDDGATTSILANSIWLRDGHSYNEATISLLAQEYYASAFSGQMGDESYNEMLRNWLNEQTGGLLSDQAEGISMESATIMALASTVYFNARWESTFSQDKTAQGVFHTPKGDVTCDFLNASSSAIYYWSDQFSAVSKYFDNNSGRMWFILPDEGVDINDVLADPDALALVTGADTWENRKHLIVNMSVPKFDVVSDMDMINDLQALGVTDVFNSEYADFSPISDDEGTFISQVKHAARVKIDEEGVEAAAYTVMLRDGAGMPPEEEVNFVVDRPFIFVITGIDGEILFAGVVNTP